MKMPTANKSLELSAKVVIQQVDTLSRKSRCLDFDSGRQLNSMLDFTKLSLQAMDIFPYHKSMLFGWKSLNDLGAGIVQNP